MNVLAAPFLYAARSEAEAFVAFHRFITHECPGYVRGAMDGVHKGLALVDKVLAIVDPKLSLYLIGKGMNAELYAFPSVLTLCACTPPLPEVLRLWDFLFAYGAHLNILCIVAQLVILRNSILSSPRYVSFPQFLQTILTHPAQRKSYVHSLPCKRRP
jgi:cell cycle arrest protein BUB2